MTDDELRQRFLYPNGTLKNKLNLQDAETFEYDRFLEERFGRNLALSLVENGKSAIRRRIAGVLTSDDIDLNSKLPTMDSNARGLTNLREDDIYLSIWNLCLQMHALWPS